MKKKTLFIILGILVAVLILGSMTNLTDKLKGDKDDDDTTAAVTTTEAAVTVPEALFVAEDANGDAFAYSDSPVFSFTDNDDTVIINKDELLLLESFDQSMSINNTTHFSFGSRTINDASMDCVYFSRTNLESSKRYLLHFKQHTVLPDNKMSDFVYVTEYSSKISDYVNFTPMNYSEGYISFVFDTSTYSTIFFNIDSSLTIYNYFDLYLYEVPST